MTQSEQELQRQLSHSAALMDLCPGHDLKRLGQRRENLLDGSVPFQILILLKPLVLAYPDVLTKQPSGLLGVLTGNRNQYALVVAMDSCEQSCIMTFPPQGENVEEHSRIRNHLDQARV